MIKFNLLADSQSEVLAGGTFYKKTPSRKPSTPAYSYTTLNNKVVISQSNNATNIGIGSWGFGGASSFQGNSADVINIIG
jgi:hypothetical protein